MKVLFLASRYAPHAIGGAERVAATLAQSLTRAGHEIVVLTTTHGDDPPERMVDGIRVRNIPLRNVYDFARPGHGLRKAVWHFIDSANPLMTGAVSQVLREERPDVMHSHLVTGFSTSAWGAAAGTGVPVVHTLHDHYVICARSSMATMDGGACRSQHLACALLSQPRKRASRRVDAVVGVSRYILDRHREFGAFRTNQSWVIPNPCHLVGTEVRSRAAEPQRPLRLGFLGRLEPPKGIDRLLAATRALPPSGWTLTVAGTGLPHFVAELHREYDRPPVSFVGRVDPAEFLSQIDLLVVPSVFPETFGLSAAEALAMGVPVVASTVAALPELIEPGRNGFVYDPGVDGALVHILSRVIEDPSVIAGMAGACRDSVAALAPSLVARRYVEVYEAVTAR